MKGGGRKRPELPADWREQHRAWAGRHFWRDLESVRRAIREGAGGDE